MRALRALCGALLLLALLALPAGAADPQAALEGLIDPEQGLSQELVEQIGPWDGAVEGFGAKLLGLLRRAAAALPDSGLAAGLRTLGILLAASLFCAVLEDGEHSRAAVPLVGALTVAAACTGSVDSMIRLGTETIRELQRYTELLLPGMAALMTASGNLTAAAASGLGMVLFDLLLRLVSGLLTPLLYLYLALSVSGSALGLEQLAGLRDFVKWLLVTAVKALMWAYTGVLGLTGLVSGAVDAQKLRTLRAAISGMVPVVGNLVSEASGSLLSAAALLRAGTGLYGMLAVFGICLLPFLRIGLQYLLLRLAGALCGLFGKGSQRPLLEELTRVMGLVLALTGIACLLALMILVLCIRTVSP